VAPERSVIDRYDINGYFTKVELTEDKLYSLVKAGVRQFDFTSMAIGAFEVVTHAIAASDSWDNLARALNGSLEQMPLDAAGSRVHEYHQQVSVIVGDRVLTTAGYSEAQARAERDRLERRGLQPIDAEGNGYVVDGKTFMVKVRASQTNDDAYHLMNIVGTPSVADVLICRVFTKAIAALAKRIETTARREVAVTG
jgi:hypothetical protein